MPRRLNPNSKAGRIRAAKATLRALLRTPKTRDGLVAAAKSRGVTANFVYGWLSQCLREGEVVELKSTDPVTYQMSAYAAAELPKRGAFPEWLEPRTLPPHRSSSTFLEGVEVGQKEKEQ